MVCGVGVLHDNTYICPTVLFFVVSGGEEKREGLGQWGLGGWVAVVVTGGQRYDGGGGGGGGQDL